MKKGKEMFEAIEMHVERMLAKLSEAERIQNSTLTKHEREMQKLLDRLRKVVAVGKTESEKSEDTDAHV